MGNLPQQLLLNPINDQGKQGDRQVQHPSKPHLLLCSADSAFECTLAKSGNTQSRGRLIDAILNLTRTVYVAPSLGDGTVA
jgi:hypothetical protein